MAGEEVGLYGVRLDDVDCCPISGGESGPSSLSPSSPFSLSPSSTHTSTPVSVPPPDIPLNEGLSVPIIYIIKSEYDPSFDCLPL